MLIYTKHDPRFYDKRLYKGGDGGAGDMRAQEQARQDKQSQSIDAINAMFGHARSTPLAAPTREAFSKAKVLASPASTMEMGGGGGDGGGGNPTYYTIPEVVASEASFDDAGYNAAVAKYQADMAAPNANRDKRAAMYNDIQGAVTATNKRELDRQFTEANSQNLIGLARSGLSGSGMDANSQGQLKERYGEGTLRATQAGMSAAADLRSADEKTRQNLIGLAQSGIDAGTTAGLAASQMDAAAKTAQAQTNTASLGRLFDDISQAYVGANKAKVAPAAYSPYGGSASLFGAKGYSGAMS